MMKAQSVGDAFCIDLDMVELETAIKAMKAKGAPRKDDIPPPILKNQAPTGKQELLEILNDSFGSTAVPPAGDTP